jgi:hypothetical protein
MGFKDLPHTILSIKMEDGWKIEGSFAVIISNRHKFMRMPLERKAHLIIRTSSCFEESGFNQTREHFSEIMDARHVSPLNEEETRNYEKVLKTIKRKTTIHNKVRQICQELGWR